MPDKQEIRKQVAGKRREISPARATAAALSVSRVLVSLPEMVAARVVALYRALAGEIDLEEVFLHLNRQGKETLLPRFDKAAGAYEMVVVGNLSTDMVPGHYGIQEPASGLPAAPEAKLAAADTVWCIPGVAFDAAGHRLGRGGGYYDRLLKRVKGTKIGIAYDWQVLPEVPHEKHDVMMDQVLTECQHLHCRPLPA